MPLNSPPEIKLLGNRSNGTVGTVQKIKKYPTGRSNGCRWPVGTVKPFQRFPKGVPTVSSRSNAPSRAFQRFPLLPRNQFRSNRNTFLPWYRIDSIQGALERRLKGLQLSSLWLLQIQLSTRSKMAHNPIYLTMHSPNQVQTKPWRRDTSINPNTTQIHTRYPV